MGNCDSIYDSKSKLSYLRSRYYDPEYEKLQ